MNSFGRRLLALAFAAFGILYLLHAVSHAFFPGPPWQASASPVINAVAGVLFLGAAAVLGLPKAPDSFCVGVTILLLAYAACRHGTAILANPANPLPWTSACEVAGLAGGCLAASGSGVRGGRILYGLSLVVFAVQHVRFHAFVATLVPAWYPMNAIWPYVTAAGFVAGAVSYVAGVQVRLASILLAVMFLLFAFTLHAPDVLAHLTSGGRWTSMCVALGFAGGALVFAGGDRSKST
jgi:uncharacterized membrane protein YphA (DoxX/SURF4 family)